MKRRRAGTTDTHGVTVKKGHGAGARDRAASPPRMAHCAGAVAVVVATGAAAMAGDQRDGAMEKAGGSLAQDAPGGRASTARHTGACRPG